MLLKKRFENILQLQGAWSRVSGSGTIFSCWCWNYSWWAAWGGSCDLELELYSFSSDTDGVVAITPFFTRQLESEMGFNVKQLQFIGNIYPTDITILSEYTDLPMNPDYSNAVSAALNDLLDSIRWDYLVVPFTAESSYIHQFLVANKSRFKYFRVKKEGVGAVIDVTGSFEEYLMGLGRNTRLKLYNRRSILHDLGTVEIEYAKSDSVEEFLSDLNTLNEPRWGRICFGPQSFSFHSHVAREASRQGNLMLSRIVVNGEVVSVLYNIRFNHVEYNIQSAYKQDFHAKISLGTLHLGYSIEGAFSEQCVREFDLLFGEGKNTFYKGRLGARSEEFYTIQCGNSYRSLLLYYYQRGRAGIKFVVRKTLSWGGSIQRLSLRVFSS